MKTTPMQHQEVGADLLAANPKYYALGCEQGTGKTWMLIDDAERQYNAGLIDALLVIAPKGVHTNWIRREIPKHASVPIESAAYFSGSGKKKKAAVERLFRKHDALVVLSMNVDAVNTIEGRRIARKFLLTHRTMMVIDESSRIKTPTSARTKHLIDLGTDAVSRRIASGTPITNSPTDIFAQFEFLRSGLLGTRSYRAFVAEFAEVLPEGHPLLVAIMAKSRSKITPQVIARDSNGFPRFRNLDKLRKLIEPYMYRVLKRDCLDLPEKIYQTRDFELTAAQRKTYDDLNAKLRIEWDDGTLDAFDALTKITKLQQVTSGFIMRDGEATVLPRAADNPRLELLRDILQDNELPVIIWARFREELSQIAELCEEIGIAAAQYNGATSTKAREAAVDDFQSGAIQAFIGQPQSGGIGLTLTAARSVIYYSNDYSLETRLQSEDRAHRIGTTGNVLYIDLVAEGTIDERIADSLQRKEATAAAILD